MRLPYMVEIPDPTIAAHIAPHCYALGAVVIADAQHVPEPHRSTAVVRIDAVRPEECEVDVCIIGCDWTLTLDWEPYDLPRTARSIIDRVANPYEYFGSADELPEGTPQRVIDWFDFDDEG